MFYRVFNTFYSAARCRLIDHDVWVQWAVAVRVLIQGSRVVLRVVADLQVITQLVTVS
jgi:hypothetical protein